MTPDAAPMAAPIAAPDLSPITLILHADPIVQGVMLLLLLASLACWAIILEKAVTFRRLAAEARQLAAGPAESKAEGEGLAAAALRAGEAALREGRDPAET
ncbi:MAG: flagellar motor protein MotA, partial [Paracraurococcus sp.]